MEDGTVSDAYVNAVNQFIAVREHRLNTPTRPRTLYLQLVEMECQAVNAVADASAAVAKAET